MVDMNIIWRNFIFPPPSSSMFVMLMTIITFVSILRAGLKEFRGKHLQYSKLLNWNKNNKSSNSKSLASRQNYPPPKFQIKVLTSKVGMFVLYAPAFVFGVASFLVFPDEGLRFLLLRLALTIHFLKRVLEVLFVHKFGGSGVTLDAAITISLSYFLSTLTMIYTQHLSREFPEPLIDLKYVGVGLFLVGILGNFYHHYILSTLRNEGEKEYKIPKGGLFNQVICPHYLFEVLIFLGVSCIAQTLYSCAFTAGTALYLSGRSYATRKWYLSKFEDFPQDVKALIPFIF